MPTKVCLICDKDKDVAAYAPHPEHPARLDNLMCMCDLCLNTFKINKDKANGFVIGLTLEEIEEILTGEIV